MKPHQTATWAVQRRQKSIAHRRPASYSARRLTQWRLLPAPRRERCICRTHIPDPGSGRGLRSGVDTQRFNLCGSRVLSNSRTNCSPPFGQARNGRHRCKCRGDCDFSVFSRTPDQCWDARRGSKTLPCSGGSSRSTLLVLRLLAVAGLQPRLNRCAFRRVARASGRRLRRLDSGRTSLPASVAEAAELSVAHASFRSTCTPRNPHRRARTHGRPSSGLPGPPTDPPLSGPQLLAARRPLVMSGAAVERALRASRQPGCEERVFKSFP
jgi:hypothetical protein